MGVLSCGKEDNEKPLVFFETYYPLEFGTYIDYYVQEITHDDLSSIPHDTLHYYLRTLIEDTVIDNEGRLAYKYIRKTRIDTSDVWQISDVWTTLKNENKINVFSADNLDEDIFEIDLKLKTRMKNENITYIPMLDYLCEEQFCLNFLTRDGKLYPLSTDTIHLSIFSSMFIAENLFLEYVNFKK